MKIDYEELLAGKDVLVAEDNDSNYMLLKYMLKNVSLDRAYDGVEAVEKAMGKKYGIILMDMRMPRMGGLEATRKIREFDQMIPIVAVTANAFDSDKEDAFEAGCNGFIAKPVSKENLTKVLKEVMS